MDKKQQIPDGNTAKPAVSGTGAERRIVPAEGAGDQLPASATDIRSSTVRQLVMVLNSLPRYSDSDRKEGIEVSLSEFEKSMNNAYQYTVDRKTNFAGSALSNAAYAGATMARSLDEVSGGKAAREAYISEARTHMQSAKMYEQQYYSDYPKLFDFAIPELDACAKALEKAGDMQNANNVYSRELELLAKIAERTQKSECNEQILMILTATCFRTDPAYRERLEENLAMIRGHGVSRVEAFLKSSTGFGSVLDAYKRIERFLVRVGDREGAAEFAADVRNVYSAKLGRAILTEDFGYALPLHFVGIGMFHSSAGQKALTSILEGYSKSIDKLGRSYMARMRRVNGKDVMEDPYPEIVEESNRMLNGHLDAMGNLSRLLTGSRSLRHLKGVDERESARVVLAAMGATYAEVGTRLARLVAEREPHRLWRLVRDMTEAMEPWHYRITDREGKETDLSRQMISGVYTDTFRMLAPVLEGFKADFEAAPGWMRMLDCACFCLLAVGERERAKALVTDMDRAYRSASGSSTRIHAVRFLDIESNYREEERRREDERLLRYRASPDGEESELVGDN